MSYPPLPRTLNGPNLKLHGMQEAGLLASTQKCAISVAFGGVQVSVKTSTPSVVHRVNAS